MSNVLTVIIPLHNPEDIINAKNVIVLAKRVNEKDMKMV